MKCEHDSSRLEWTKHEKWAHVTITVVKSLNIRQMQQWERLSEQWRIFVPCTKYCIVITLQILWQRQLLYLSSAKKSSTGDERRRTCTGRRLHRVCAWNDSWWLTRGKRRSCQWRFGAARGLRLRWDAGDGVSVRDNEEWGDCGRADYEWLRLSRCCYGQLFGRQCAGCWLLTSSDPYCHQPGSGRGPCRVRVRVQVARALVLRAQLELHPRSARHRLQTAWFDHLVAERQRHRVACRRCGWMLRREYRTPLDDRCHEFLEFAFQKSARLTKQKHKHKHNPIKFTNVNVHVQCISSVQSWLSTYV